MHITAPQTAGWEYTQQEGIYHNKKSKARREDGWYPGATLEDSSAWITPVPCKANGEGVVTGEGTSGKHETHLHKELRSNNARNMIIRNKH